MEIVQHVIVGIGAVAAVWGVVRSLIDAWQEG